MCEGLWGTSAFTVSAPMPAVPGTNSQTGLRLKMESGDGTSGNEDYLALKRGDFFLRVKIRSPFHRLPSHNRHIG